MASPPVQTITSRNEGSIFIFSLLMVLMLMGLITTMFVRSGTDLNVSERLRQQEQAFHLAEAGLDQALTSLRQAPFGTTTPPQIPYTPLGVGEFAASVGPPIPVSGGGYGYQIQGTGYFPDHQPASRGFQQQTVEAYVILTGPSLFPYGAFGDQSVRFTGNASTDSYDSSQGTYDPATAGLDGSVATNGITAQSVTLTGNARVGGNVTVGPGGDPTTAISISGNATIVGTASAASASTPLPPVTIPAGVTHLGHLSLSGNTIMNLPDGTYWFSSISISGNARLNFTGPASVYLSGSLSVSGNGIGTADNRPPNLLIYQASTSIVHISGNGNFYGAVYAPQSAISISGNGQIFGAMVGRTLTDSGNGDFHYDQALQSVKAAGSLQVEIQCWSQPN